MKYVRKKLKKVVKRKEWVICTFSFVMLLIIGGGIFTYGKYVSVQSKEGMAIASSVYFDSNCLKQMGTDEELKEYYNPSVWNGQDECSIKMDIRNYENRLLYNDSSVGVKYDISFQLEKNDSKWGYRIVYGEGQGEKFEIKYTDTKVETNDVTQLGEDARIEVVRQADGTGDIVTIYNVSLDGGMARSNTFYIKIKSNIEQNDMNIVSPGVKVWATTKEPNYMMDKYKLGAMIKASSSQADFTASGVMALAKSLTTGNFQSVIASQSGFVYEIRTMGGSSVDKHRLKITWDPQLEIEYSDPYYKIAVKKNDFGTDTNGRKYMKIDVEPYLVISMNFFQTSLFNIEKITSIDVFKELVDISIIS